MGLSLPDYKYGSVLQEVIFYRDLIQKIENIPGVKAAGAEGGGSNVFFQPQGQPAAAPGHEPTASYKIVTPDLLQAMGTRSCWDASLPSVTTRAASQDPRYTEGGACRHRSSH